VKCCAFQVGLTKEIGYNSINPSGVINCILSK